MSKTSTGNRSTGDWSTGHWSTGNYSTGNWSTGNYSTGHYSTGDWSTGDWSISNYSTGHFSTEDYSGFGCFDRLCTLEEWEEAKIPSCLYFDLTEWVKESDMTEQEKTENPSYKTTGGYLKVYAYKEAFTRSMERATDEELEQVKALPNFDADKFYQISGYRFDEKKSIVIDGKEIKISKESFEELKKVLLKEQSK